MPTLSVAALVASPVNVAACTFENPNAAVPNVNVLSAAGTIPVAVTVPTCVSTPAPLVTLNFITPLFVIFCITPSKPLSSILNWKSNLLLLFRLEYKCRSYLISYPNIYS